MPAGENARARHKMSRIWYSIGLGLVIASWPHPAPARDVWILLIPPTEDALKVSPNTWAKRSPTTSAAACESAKQQEIRDMEQRRQQEALAFFKNVVGASPEALDHSR